MHIDEIIVLRYGQIRAANFLSSVICPLKRNLQLGGGVPFVCHLPSRLVLCVAFRIANEAPAPRVLDLSKSTLPTWRLFVYLCEYMRLVIACQLKRKVTANSRRWWDIKCIYGDRDWMGSTFCAETRHFSTTPSSGNRSQIGQ